MLDSNAARIDMRKIDDAIIELREGRLARDEIERVAVRDRSGVEDEFDQYIRSRDQTNPRGRTVKHKRKRTRVDG